jgi:hypothetical protein
VDVGRIAEKGDNEAQADAYICGLPQAKSSQYLYILQLKIK